MDRVPKQVPLKISVCRARLGYDNQLIYPFWTWCVLRATEYFLIKFKNLYFKRYGFMEYPAGFPYLPMTAIVVVCHLDILVFVCLRQTYVVCLQL